MDLDNLNSFVKLVLGRELTAREVLMLNEAIDRYGFDIDLAREKLNDGTIPRFVFTSSRQIGKSAAKFLELKFRLSEPSDSGQHEQLLNDCRCLKCRMGKVHQCTTRKTTKRGSK